MSGNERETELAEYQAIQTSRLFSGDTNSTRFLKFVCGKHFAGIREVSETEIAIEAFGRRPDFDPAQDSIVRVEAHRVRKRLGEYYTEEGVSHSIRLTIPHGTYMPHFAPSPKAREDAAGSPQFGTETKPSDDESAEATVAFRENERGLGQRPSKMRILSILLLAGVTIAVVFGLYFLRFRKGQILPRPAPIAELPVLSAQSSEVLIMAGSTAKSYTDQLGHVWTADRYYKGGEPWTVSYRHISRTDDPQLFLTSRQGQDFGYEIPLSPGIYELRLYFAETFYGEGNREGGGESSRIFDVTANGSPILSEFDPLSDAGGSNTADIRVFSGVSPAADGKLHLEFQSHWQLKSIASVNAIQIVRTGRRSMMPIRWVAADSAIEDREGNLWLPDQSVEGGRRREFTDVVTNTNDSELNQSERYGNFSYVIPVSANNTYTLTLHLSEHWWGIPDFGGPPDTAIGRRVFDVYCNGVYLLQDYDIFKQAGGSLRAVSVTVHGIKPNHQGKIQLSFVPAKHYASIDALEIKPEQDN